MYSATQAMHTICTQMFVRCMFASALWVRIFVTTFFVQRPIYYIA